MPLQSTSGAASYDAFGGGTTAKVNYIEDFFQSYLRTGTGASATVTTGLDGSTKETLVWTKSRSAATNHKLTDNVRGATKALSSNTTGAEATDSQGLTAFSATGYTIGTNTDYNNSGATYVDWQWVSQPKFFDVVTFTGNGVDGRAISHSLGSVPGCILLKKTSAADDWYVYHRSGGNGTSNGLGVLNSTAAFDTGSNAFGGPGSVSVAPTSTTFTIRNSLNDSGATYVAYLFAHNAGGFGLTGTDNVISCGSYTGNGSTSGPVTTLGYEPQWILIKNASATTGGWVIVDNMRGLPVGKNSNVLRANTSGAEVTSVGGLTITATGFQQHDTDPNFNEAGSTYIYIAIRRGPMKVPTSGTSVFDADAATSAANLSVTTNFPSDLVVAKQRNATSTGRFFWIDRLRGSTTTSCVHLNSTATSAETSNATNGIGLQSNTSIIDNLLNPAYGVVTSSIYYNFKRAPSFFDEVCYTGNGTTNPITHNLTVSPELVITKRRSTTGVWYVIQYVSGCSYSQLETTDAFTSLGTSFPVTNTTFTPIATNSGQTFVTYLFATCAGVSKVGSYTGTGTTLQVDCGFTGGARFVMIKRTDSTGDWYVWDTARGIVAGNDPYLLLNSISGEVTTNDYIDTYSAGFEISSTAPAAINASGGTFIFLAIA